MGADLESEVVTMRNVKSKTVGGDRATLASIIEGSDDAILSMDLAGTIMTWNPAAELLFGYSEREIVGQPITLLFPPERMAEERRILTRLRDGQGVEHYETVRLKKNGQPVDVSISASPIRNVSGHIIGASKIARDITARKLAEAALREGEQRTRAILDGAVDAIVTIDEFGLIESANRATERLFGYPVSELIGKNVKVLMPEPFADNHDQYLQNYRRSAKPRIIGIGREVTGLHRNGNTFPIHLSVGEVQLEGRRVFTGFVHDLTDRRELERQIIEATGAEQRRIGQDLHDGLCQDLVGIAMQADHALRQLQTNAARDAEDTVRGIAVSVRQAATDTRELSHGLHPIDIHEGGLPIALEALAAKTSLSFNVRCVFRRDGDWEVRDDMTATHLYRIAQEAIGNAIKHGKAKQIIISLSCSKVRIALSVQDNGVGLPQSAGAVAGNGAPPGIGLQTMRYRAHMVGGAFDVHSKGRNTMVRCSINKPAAPPRRGSAARSRRASVSVRLPTPSLASQ